MKISEIIKILDECPNCISSGCCYECDDTCDNHMELRIQLGDLRGEFK